MSSRLHCSTMPTVHAPRRFSLGPPDTDRDSSHIPPVSLSVNPGIADLDMTPASGHVLDAAAEHTRPQLPGPSALSYRASGARGPCDRSYARSQRNLVVVIPPPDLPLDRGHLGNVLSMGPRHRLSQGVLMPLFPSVFGQLNAIAREYNFPSTIGLCLYLHVNENGNTMTPRISDDSWQYLFGHLFEGHPPSGYQSPIGGSIEFDVDLNKARWFDAWVAGTSRDSDPASPPVLTFQASFGAHRQGESQSTSANEQSLEDQWDVSGSHTLTTISRPETLRHPLRKLSLVDRLDPHIVQALPKSQNLPDSRTHALSPIPQSAIPQLAESDLEARVNSWRATTELFPVSMTEIYQPASDVGVSVSATSWGLVDDECYPVVWDISRLPSPDLGERMVEDAMTPRPCAVWGNSFGWRSAVTWKEVYPYSATKTKAAIQLLLQGSNMPGYSNSVIYPTARFSPDGCSPHNVFKHVESSALSVWGSSFGWQGAVTWQEVYPFSKVKMQLAVSTRLRGAGGLESKYPNSCIYPAVYPNPEIHYARTEDTSQPVSRAFNSSNLMTSYPSLVIYPTVYPHLDIYPPVVEGVNMKGSSQVDDTNTYSLDGTLSCPNRVIYSAVYPHFDLYPGASEITKSLKREKVHVGCFTAEHPNAILYSSACPHLETHPTRGMMRPVSSVVWGVSFGWPTAKTWLRVYPLHTTKPLTRGGADDQSRSMSRPLEQIPAIANIAVGKWAVWGSSFGWESGTTWRAVWPIAHTRIYPNAEHLGQRGGSSLNYPYLTIYPAADPHFNMYPHRAAVVEAEESQVTKKIRCTIDLIPCYPNLVIYPAVYPHLDVYPAIARDLVAVERGEGQCKLHPIEMWRDKTAARVKLGDLVCNNHIWEVDQPLRLDFADDTWCRSSVGPPMSPLELPHRQSVLGLMHTYRPVQGSVLLTPPTATTWRPQDDGRHSDIDSIKKRLPPPDLGQRIPDGDVQNGDFPPRSSHVFRPFFGNANQAKSHSTVLEKPSFVPEYPRLVIYAPAYPHFELYPSWANVTTSKNRVAETPANLIIYPALDTDPTIYPHSNIYSTDLPEIPGRVVSNEGMEVRFPSLYPNFDIYQACYPHNLDYIYPSVNAIESTQIPVNALTPLMPVSEGRVVQEAYADDWATPVVTRRSRKTHMELRVSVFRSLGKRPARNSKMHLLLHTEVFQDGVVWTPSGCMQEGADVGNLETADIETRRERKTHMELRALVFRSLGKRPVRNPKTHVQLHTEVFQNGIVWTPSGYVQDIAPLARKKPEDVPIREQWGRLSQDNLVSRPSRSKSVTNTVISLDKVAFPLTHPPPPPPLSPLCVRSPGLPSPPSPAVSETPMPRVPLSSITRTHKWTPSSRLTQAVKAMMPGLKRRSSSAASQSPPPEVNKDRVKDHPSPSRFLSSVDRRSAVVPPLPQTNTSEFLTRALPSSQKKESLVLRRARAYGQATGAP